jgi:hypothetical protein
MDMVLLAAAGEMKEQQENKTSGRHKFRSVIMRPFLQPKNSPDLLVAGNEIENSAPNRLGIHIGLLTWFSRKVFQHILKMLKHIA